MVPVTYQSNQLRGRRKAARSSLRLGAASVRLLGIVILALLSLLYIAQSSQGAGKNKTLEQMREEAEQLVNEEEQLQLDALRAQALNELNNSVPQLGLEPAPQAEQLSLPE